VAKLGDDENPRVKVLEMIGLRNAPVQFDDLHRRNKFLDGIQRISDLSRRQLVFLDCGWQSPEMALDTSSSLECTIPMSRIPGITP
jgi:hypothetical protein